MKHNYFISLCIFIFLLTACQLESITQQNTPFIPLSPAPVTPAITPTTNIFSTLVPSTVQTPNITPLSTIELLPTELYATSPTPLDDVCALTLVDSIDINVPIQGVFVFGTYSSSSYMTANGVNQAPGLNAISVDGMCGGVLDSNVKWNWQPDRSPQLVVASISNTSSVTFATNQISQIPTPEECTRPDNASDMWQPCHNFAFSPDGHWLTYNWGDDYCGQNLNLVDLATREKRTIGGSTWLIQFLSSGEMLIGQSACERGWLRVYDPETGALENLGDAGEMHWNSTKTTFIVETSAYVGVARGLWGYNLQTESFLLLPTAGYQSVPLWTPDGSHVIFEHRDVFGGADEFTLSFGPNQIWIVDMHSGQSKMLVSDPEYNFFLCQSSQIQTCEWNGDWLEVRQIAFEAGEYNFEDGDGTRCTLRGQGCSMPIKPLGLNWRTGELVLWSQLTLPTPMPTVTPQFLPDNVNMSQSPLYVNEETGASFYIGSSGRTLWCVPPEGMGEPVQWVDDAEFFMYIPENQ